MSLLKKLTNYKAKRELCYDIAKAYEQMRGEAQEVINRAASNIPVYSSPSSPEEKSAIVAHTTAFLIYQQIAMDCSTEAEFYRTLAKSKKLYFVRTSKLEKILKEPPLKVRSRTIEAQLPCGTTVGMEMKA